MFFYKLLAARHFGPSDFGIYSLAETILSLAVLVITLGITQGITRYIPLYLYRKDAKSLRGYLHFIFKFPLIFSIGVGIVLFFLSPLITAFFGFPPFFTDALKIIAIILPFRIVNNVLRKIFIAKKKVIYREIAYNVFESGFVLLGVLVIIFFELSLIWLIVNLCLSVFIAALYCIYIFKKKIRFEPSPKKTYKIKSWLAFSLPLFFSGFFSYFIVWSDNLVIGKLLTSEQLGIYAVAFSLANILPFFMRSFSTIFIPFITETNVKGKHSQTSFLFKKSAAWIFGLSFPLFLFLVVFSAEILDILYGTKYIAGQTVLQILAVGMILNISMGLSERILLLHKQTPFIFWNNAIMAIFNIFLTIILVPVLGIVGAAISSAISLVLVRFVFLLKACRYEKIRFDWLYNLKFIISGVIAILVAWKLTVFIQNPWFMLIIAGTIYLFFYAFLLLLLKTFHEEDFAILDAIEKKMGINLAIIKRIMGAFY